jgi:hypothetical protein
MAFSDGTIREDYSSLLQIPSSAITSIKQNFRKLPDAILDCIISS